MALDKTGKDIQIYIYRKLTFTNSYINEEARCYLNTKKIRFLLCLTVYTRFATATLMHEKFLQVSFFQEHFPVHMLTNK